MLRKFFRCFVVLAIMLNVISCDDEKELDPNKISQLEVNFSVHEVGVTWATFTLGVEGADAKEVFFVYGTSPGLTENSPNKQSGQPGDDFKIEGLTEKTKYYARGFAIGTDNKLVSTTELSFETEVVTLITPTTARAGAEVEIMGNFFSDEEAGNIVKFGDIPAEVTSATPSLLKVIVPETLGSTPVKISVTSGGITKISLADFVVNSIFVTSFTPESGRIGDVVRVDGEGLPEDGVVYLAGTPQATTYHPDLAGSYYTFVIGAEVEVGEHDIEVYDHPITEIAPSKFTVLPMQWFSKSNYANLPFESAVSFVAGNKAYFGLGRNGDGLLKEFWEYDMTTDVWTRKTDFPAAVRENAIAFSIDGKGYVGTGSGAGFTLFKDFWQYDPATDMWTQKADFAGSARAGAVSFAVAGQGYIGMGRDENGLLKDFWKYDPTNDSWVQLADFGGAAREFASAFVITGKAYVGTGNSNALQVLADFWEFDPGNNSWTQKADYAGGGRSKAVAFAIGENGFVTTGFDNQIEATKDCWEFHPTSNEWVRMQDLIGDARWGAVGFSNNERGFVFSGGIDNNEFKLIWEFNPN